MKRSEMFCSLHTPLSFVRERDRVHQGRTTSREAAAFERSPDGSHVPEACGDFTASPGPSGPTRFAPHAATLAQVSPPGSPFQGSGTTPVRG